MKFPDQYWDAKKRAELATIAFLAEPDWETLCDPGPFDPRKTPEEVDELLKKQDDPERIKRTPQIIREATEITKDFSHLLLFREDSHVHTKRVFWQAIWVGRTVVMHFKNKYSRPRPAQIEPRLRPVVSAPGHPSYPSGHSTQMHLVAHVLSDVTSSVATNDTQGQLFEIAGRVAVNREWGGVHYASDSRAGAELANAIYPVLKKVAKPDFDAAASEWL